jgi:predicted nucleic acid-binding protein
MRRPFFIIGEIACGHLKARERVLSLLAALPRIARTTEEEALFFLENRRLFGRGLGYIDLHLLASASLRAGTHLWTRDKRLHALASELNPAY